METDHTLTTLIMQSIQFIETHMAALTQQFIQQSIAGILAAETLPEQEQGGTYAQQGAWEAITMRAITEAVQHILAAEPATES